VLQFQYGFTTWMDICWGSLVFAPGDAHSNGSRLAAQLEPVPRGQSLEPEHLPGPGRDQFGRHHQQHYCQVRQRAFSPGLRTELPVGGQSWNDNYIQDTAHRLKGLLFTNFEVVDLSPAVTNLSPTQAGAGASVTISGCNYSGAAGRLSVWFRSNQVPATVTDDAHVTAIAPPSSGTVDVRSASTRAFYRLTAHQQVRWASEQRSEHARNRKGHAYRPVGPAPPSSLCTGGMCRNMGLIARRNPFAIKRMHPRPCDQAVPLPCPFLLQPAVPGAPHSNGLL